MPIKVEMNNLLHSIKTFFLLCYNFLLLLELSSGPRNGIINVAAISAGLKVPAMIMVDMVL